MPQMNDSDQTEVNLTKMNLKGVKYEGQHMLALSFMLNDVLVETNLMYGTSTDARRDYSMLIDMLNASEGSKQLLNETFNGYVKNA